MKSIFPYNFPYNLRKDHDFKTENIRTVSYGSEIIAFRGPKIWAVVPENIKNSNTLPEFKAKIKHWEPEGCMCRICKV